MNKSILVSLSFVLLMACGKKEKENEEYNPFRLMIQTEEKENFTILKLLPL
jgi:hypothetical protein